MADTDLDFLSWLDTARLIRERAISPVTVVNHQLERITSLDGGLNAFIHVCADSALECARRAERDLTQRRSVGPLHGVPFSLKDIVDAVDLPTTAHSRILMDNTARADAFVTAQLKQAGGILLGKLATHEFALGGPAFDLPWPPARNPWDRRRHPGGSSSGAGAAVAAGMVSLAIGTDTAGSVRNPASACGIVGMKPTYGLISRRGVFPLSFSLDTVGLLTRTVSENAAALNLVAGFDAADPTSANRPPPDFTTALGRDITGLRVGVIKHFHQRDEVADPQVSHTLDSVCDRLADLGADLVEVETRPLDEFIGCNRVIMLSEAYSIHERWLKTRPGDYSALTRRRLLEGAFLSASDYLRANRTRRHLTSAMGKLLNHADVLVCASSLDPPCLIDDANDVARTYPRHARAPFNVSGHPAIALPGGFTDTGLPVGFQIIGKHFDEQTVYRVAHAFEAVTPWSRRHPPSS